MEDIFKIEDQWLEWYKLSPQERWAYSQELWNTYLYLGCSLDPEPDTQSPFFDSSDPVTLPLDGRTGLRIIRGI